MGKADSAFGRSQKIEDTTIGWRFINPKMKDMYGVDAMPQTADNVADEWGISREDQDAFALRSQQRTAAAQQAGFFAEEIVPVVIKGRKGDTVVATDEHPRADTTAEALARLKPVNGEGKTVTAGNASGVNDGAAAMILASAEAVQKYGLAARPGARHGQCRRRPTHHGLWPGAGGEEVVRAAEAGRQRFRRYRTQRGFRRSGPGRHA